MPAFNNTTIEYIDIPFFNKIPEGAPWAFDAMSVAHHLGIRNRTMMHMIINRKSMYKKLTIPKKSGGVRVLHAPEDRLKYVQGQLLDKFFTPVKHPMHMAAYVPSRATRHSAEQHANKPVLVVLDLKDFFPSTRRAWVRRAMQGVFNYNYEVASVIADLTTIPIDTPLGTRYVVPQGAPTSGAVCNWVAHHRLDIPLLELCKENEFTYTRYADDLAFSCEKALPRKEVNAFLKKIYKAVKDSGYRVNFKKLRVTRKNKQQRLLGMVVNEKPNIVSTDYRNLRARLHHCKYKGFDQVAKEMGVESGEALKSQISGKISYYHMINPVKAAKLQAQYDEALGGTVLHAE